MSPDKHKNISKFLSLVLRHDPGILGLELTNAGWVEIQRLLDAMQRHGKVLSREDLEMIVKNSDKQRYAISPDGKSIRANQGHSIEIDLEYAPQQPPEILYHGTATRFLADIRKLGLQKMNRHHVHLSAETKVTIQVGGRHGKPALLTIRAGEMHRKGLLFYCSTNGVWLVDAVSPEFIDFPAE